MTTPWPSTRIADVAPDASSLSAARKLDSSWLDTGHSEIALWGRCAGSGKNPYRTSIDTAGPAYRCSCPSRKFPCKHALSLLLKWAGGHVTAADTPADVSEWLTARAARNSPSAAPAEDRTPDVATAQRRHERVAAGLDELERWLTDRIRHGLGSVAHDVDTYEDIAARMVDAQAPGAAAVLRALPAVVSTEPDWPARVLAEYARLHLMVVAYRRRDDLPAPLVHSLRTHLGFTTRADEVRSEPAVRDHWQVLASRVTEDGRMFTRRTWVRGRTNDRWAVVLDFAHGTARFTTEIPLPGSVVDADLHFYPGASPLRALPGRVHATPESFTAPTATDLDTAFDDYARARGADPWLRTWPMLLDAVVPADTDDGWCLIDRAGRAVELGGDVHGKWNILAIAGGRPVTVCGDWDGTRFTPVSVITAGEVVSV